MGDTDVIVGIDLGTTNSLVAYCDARGPRILEGEQGERLVPSVVRYERDGANGNESVRAVVGIDARARAVEFPETTIASAKRLMGRSAAEGARDASFGSHAVVADESGSARFVVPMEGGDLVRSPQEVAAEVLRALRAQAERALGREVRRAVVTVPAYFDDAQRQATRDAGRIAGIEVVRIVNEPTAAALAYGLGLGSDRSERTIAVYDLGGGTFDISILRITPSAVDDGEERDGAEGEPGVPSVYRVLATAGDTRLGGDDVDHLLIERFLEGASKAAGRAVRLEGLGAAARRALKRFAEGVKHRLSEADEASVEVDLGLGGGSDGGDSGGAEPVVYRETITRAEFERLIEPWVERSLAACARALRDAGIRRASEELDAVVLVGGSTRVPMVRARVGAFFGLEPYTALNPDEVVALGAAVQASVLEGSFGGGGASALLLDVIPLSLGIETAGGAVAKLIMRNATVPARATERFSTQVDGQTSIKLHVLQGEREMVEDCRSLGEFHLTGLPPMPAGIPQLEVEFLVDANGVLRVSAVEQRSGRRAAIQIVPNHGLTETDIERIERESVEHAREDMTRHRIVDLVVNGRLDCSWIRDRLERFGALLEDGYRAELEEKLGAFAALLERADADWQSVDANALHAQKQALDELSVRLQEVAIRESLRE